MKIKLLVGNNFAYLISSLSVSRQDLTFMDLSCLTGDLMFSSKTTGKTHSKPI